MNSPSLPGKDIWVQVRRNHVTLVIKDDTLLRNPHLPITLEPLILAKSDQYLDLGIWDAVGRRFGTIEIPIGVHTRK